MPKTLYDVLEVSPKATPGEIDEAHRLLTRVWHPDRFGSSGQLWQRANEHLAEINRAHDILKDPRKRAAYDEQIRREQQQAAQSEQPPLYAKAARASYERAGAAARDDQRRRRKRAPWLSKVFDYSILMALVYALCLLLLDNLHLGVSSLVILSRVLGIQAGICLLLTHALLGRAVLDFRWLVVSLLGFVAYSYVHTGSWLAPQAVRSPLDPVDLALQAAWMAGAQYLFAGDRYGLSFWWVPVMAGGGFLGGLVHEALSNGAMLPWYSGWLAVGAIVGLALAVYTSTWFQKHTA